MRPSTEHIPYLNARFEQVHLTVDRGGFPYVREIAMLVGALVGALLASSALGIQLQGALGALPQVPVWGALMLAARAIVTVALLAVSLGAFSLCPSKNGGVRTVKFLVCAAFTALAWPVSLPFLPPLDVVKLLVDAAWQAAQRAVPQLAGLKTATHALPLSILGALGGGVVGLVVNAKLLKAPYYYYVGKKRAA